MMPKRLETDRLLMREWRDSDRDPFAAMSADPAVMEFFAGTLTREVCDEFVDSIRQHFAEHGFGLWAVECKPQSSDLVPFVGFVGLVVHSFEAHFTPCVEVGWRLAREHWGQGYASEAAKAAVAYAFDELALDEVVSMTVPANVRSRRVMEKVGMERDPADDFEHPRVPEGHELRPHLLYRLSREKFESDRRAMAALQEILPHQLAKLRCMQTGSRLREASESIIARVNALVQQRTLRDALGRTVDQPIHRGLVNEDATVLYPIVDGAIQMMRDESIPLTQSSEASNE